MFACFVNRDHQLKCLRDKISNKFFEKDYDKLSVIRQLIVIQKLRNRKDER